MFSTTLNAAVTSSQTTLPVNSATGLPAAGVVSVDNEIIAYASIDLSVPAIPVLYGCSRGWDGTVAMAHDMSAVVNLIGLVYPASVQTAEDLYIAINNFTTNLPVVVGANQSAIQVNNATPLPASGMVSIDNEVIFYEYIDFSGPQPVLTNCIRGFDNTTPSTHGQGASVEVRWVAAHHNTLAQAILLLQSILGANPAGAFPDMTANLAANLPLVIPWTAVGPISSMVPNTAVTINVTHNKQRLVGVQLWRLNSQNLFEKFDAPMQQNYNSGGPATVTFTLFLAVGDTEEGFIVLL